MSDPSRIGSDRLCDLLLHNAEQLELLSVGGWRPTARLLRQAAADAELVVFVFKAIRPAAATELKLASLVLEGTAGKPLELEPPGAYKASVDP